jgi:hypothetical protein
MTDRHATLKKMLKRTVGWLSLGFAIVWSFYVIYLFWGADIGTPGDKLWTDIMMAIYSLPSIGGLFVFWLFTWGD